MAARYVAGASGLPFGVLRGYVGTDLMDHTPTLAPITCPFTGEQLTAVPALNPDVAVIHAQQADRRGNVQLWGLVGVQKEAVLSARRSIVTVEEVVDELTPRPNAVVLPAWVVGAVCEVPGGAHPSFAIGYSSRDNEFYRAWDDDQPRSGDVHGLDRRAHPGHRRLRRVPGQPGAPAGGGQCLRSARTT